MKKLILAALVFVLTGCATPQEREATRRMQSYCVQQGRVVHETLFSWECITQEQAVAMQREQERRERERQVEQAREEQRRHEKEVACISAGGTWQYNSCAPGSREIRIVR